MCGIFGILSDTRISSSHLRDLAHYARQRGRDSSGIFYSKCHSYQVSRADYDIRQLLKKQSPLHTNFILIY